MTPHGPVTPGLTPGRTPLRDKLNINSEEHLADPAFAKTLVNKQTDTLNAMKKKFTYKPEAFLMAWSMLSD